MSDAELTCPFCNARVPLPPGAPVAPGTRLSCPRCDEVFPYEGGAGGAIQAPPGLTTAPAPGPAVGAAPVVRGKPIRANRLVAGIILGGMLLMALTGLTYALLTEKVRRDHDKALPRTSRRPALPPLRPLPPPETVAPARLEGLGYLPGSSGVVAGLHVQEILASPGGKELRTRPLKLGAFEVRLESLRDVTGLDLEDIDHVVLGVAVRKADGPDLTPPTHLVVRARRPFNPSQVRAAFKARPGRKARAPGGGERTVYPATVRGLPVTLWLPDDHTLVLGLFGNLEEVPEQPSEGIDHLHAEVRQLLEGRLVAGMTVWAVGHADDWKKTWLPVLLRTFKDVPVLARVEQLKSFALGIVPDRPLRLHGSFRCADEATAKKIVAEELAPRAKQEPEQFKYSRAGAWLDVQRKFAANP